VWCDVVRRATFRVQLYFKRVSRSKDSGQQQGFAVQFCWLPCEAARAMANAAAAFSPLQTFHDAPFGFAFSPLSAASPFQELNKADSVSDWELTPLYLMISKKQANFVEKT
jgi:hypothetical protein